MTTRPALGTQEEVLMRSTKDWKRLTAQCITCSLNEMDSGRKLQACGKCRGVHYCSKECQVANWPIHKATCLRMCAEVASWREASGAPEEWDHFDRKFRKWQAEFAPMLLPATLAASGVFPLKPGYNISERCLTISIEDSQQSSDLKCKAKDLFVITSWRIEQISEMSPAVQERIHDLALERTDAAAISFWIISHKSRRNIGTVGTTESNRSHTGLTPTEAERICTYIMNRAMTAGISPASESRPSLSM